MVKVLIVDDEAMARRRVRELLAGNDVIQIVGEGRSGEEALKLINDRKPELMYLDIRLSDMTGFDVLEKVPKELMPLVIFVTAYDEFAIQAFDVFSFDYILKPIVPNRFQKSLEKALQTLRP
ncbi:MAG: response regulator [Arenicellales bacterium]|jgi:two-component system LytT family response regulator